MSDDLKRIEQKIDGIAHRIGNIDVTIAKQQVSLDYHIQRTDMLTTIVMDHKDKMSEIKGAVRFLKLIGLLAGIAEAASQILRHYHG